LRDGDVDPLEQGRERPAGPRFPFWIRAAFGLIVLGGVAYAVFDAGRDVDGIPWPGPALVVLSVALLLAMLAAGARAWDVLMRGHAHGRDLLRAFALAQVSKYVPGGVAQVLGQAGHSRQAGASTSAVVTGMTAQALVGVLAPGLTSVVVLMAVDDEPSAGARVLLGVACTLGTVLLLSPRFLTAVVRSRMVARLPGVRHLEIPAGDVLLRAYAWGLVALLCLGLAFAALLLPSVDSGRDAVLVTLSYAVAFLVGFLVIPVPAGLGVREGALVALVTPVVDAQSALATAVLLRVLQLGVDVVVASGILVRGARRPRSS